MTDVPIPPLPSCLARAVQQGLVCSGSIPLDKVGEGQVDVQGEDSAPATGSQWVLLGTTFSCLEELIGPSSGGPLHLARPERKCV